MSKKLTPDQKVKPVKIKETMFEQEQKRKQKAEEALAEAKLSDQQKIKAGTHKYIKTGIRGFVLTKI